MIPASTELDSWSNSKPNVYIKNNKRHRCATEFANRGGTRKDKGLRHFSLRVCQKLQERGSATYAQVADDLLKDLAESTGQPVQEKNIRRRVYDALNVLLAIDIITKSPNQKAIEWKGLPDTMVRK